MARTTPCVAEMVLTGPGADGAPLAVGSGAWYEWLEQHSLFAFTGPAGRFTARKEARPGGQYWYAYRRQGGRLYSAYLGRSAELTPARLTEVAAGLAAAPSGAATPAPPPPAAALPLVTAKLHRPPPRPDLVPRPDLLARLTVGARGKLTVVAAPAGYGKTTLLSAWAAQAEYPVAWLALDDGDNDPARFWSYLVLALQRVYPGLGEGVLPLVRAAPPAPFAVLLPPLLEALLRLPHPLALVLDDYQGITHQAIHDGLAAVLPHLPPTVRLILGSRAEPPLSLARLRAQGDLTTLGIADLQFSTAEAGALLNEAQALGLSAAEVAALTARTEGWVAGLHLAALALRGGSDRQGVIAGFSGRHRHIRDYLAEEVLERQPAEVRHFLLHTAVLERLSGPLCDAVIGGVGGGALLRRLEQANLFLVPLDAEGQWYRYHHLFADFLRGRQQQAQPEVLPELHRRACAWYERHDAREEALGHALAAQDWVRATALILGAVEATVQRGEALTLLRWLEAVPNDVVRGNLDLSIWYAWMMLLTGQLDAVEPRLADAERQVRVLADGLSQPPATPEEAARRPPAGWLNQPRGQIAVIRSSLARARGDLAGTIAHAGQGLALVQQDGWDNPTMRTLGLLNLGQAHLARGDLAAAEAAFAEAHHLGQAGGETYNAIGALAGRAEVEIRRGRLRQADALYRQATRLAPPADPARLPAAGSAYVGLGNLRREWNELDAAAEQVARGIHLSERGGLYRELTRAYVALARVHQAQGAPEAARDQLERAAAIAHQSRVNRDSAYVAAWQARLALAQGDRAAAARWAAAPGRPDPQAAEPDGPALYEHELEYTTLARVLVAQGDPAALPLLARLAQTALAGGGAGSAIEYLLLQALATHLRGRLAAALALLADALRLAAPGGYVRTFLDEGAPLVRLLQAAQAARPQDLPAAWPAVADPAARLLQAATAPSGPGAGAPLVERLTTQERAVLQLLARHLAYRAIAQALVISENTARWHIKNIYRKLQVADRQQAVRRALELGLLIE